MLRVAWWKFFVAIARHVDFQCNDFARIAHGVDDCRAERTCMREGEDNNVTRAAIRLWFENNSVREIGRFGQFVKPDFCLELWSRVDFDHAVGVNVGFCYA